jgi:hypothetical protein
MVEAEREARETKEERERARKNPRLSHLQMY